MSTCDNETPYDQYSSDVFAVWQHCDLMAAARLTELLDLRCKDELNAARVDLKRNIDLLLAAGKVCF